MSAFNVLKATPAKHVTGLAYPSDFKIDSKNLPDYFDKNIGNWELAETPVATTDFYDYRAHQSDTYWLDYGSNYLGGGVFIDGFDQEEVLFCETPDLANAAAIPDPSSKENPPLPLIRVRELVDKSKSVLAVRNGSPTPIIKYANRVQSINTDAKNHGIYGNEAFKKASLEQIKDIVKPLTAPQRVDILSMAALG